MIISMIAAMANDHVIGKDNQMPWHLPADFAWFKRCTLGKPVIMGRKTFESIGRPLPGRDNIVISRDSSLVFDGVTMVQSLEQAIASCAHVDEVMIIGGGSVYQAALPKAQRLYLTYIDADIAGDTHFPRWSGDFREIHRERYSADEKNAYNMDFVILEK